MFNPTPGTVQDPMWTIGQWSGDSLYTDPKAEVLETNVEILNDAMTKVSQGKFSPLPPPFRKEWEKASGAEKKKYLESAEASCRIVCNVIAPKDGENLYEALITRANMQQTSKDMLSLIAAYKKAPTKRLKTQILSIYVMNYTNEELKKLHAPFEKLSDHKVKKARKQARVNGPGVQPEKETQHRVRIDMVKLDHFLSFVDRPYFYQDVAYGERTLKLESGERLTMPNIIRIVTRSTMISQYLSFSKEEGFEPLGRTTMYKVLKVREASERKSLQGLDNTSADGAEGFHRITQVVEDLQQQFGVSKDWCFDTKNSLTKAKCYLQTEFRVHCRQEESTCADHCRKFALSDPDDDDFKQKCLHRHTLKCNNCEELKTVLASIKQKLDELSSLMYNKEHYDDLLYDFEKSFKSIMEWKCHILRTENQEIAKQSLIQDLKEDSVFIVVDWAMKLLQRRYREKQSEWFAKRGMNWHVSTVLCRDEKGNIYISYYNHLFNSCSQDWFSVLSVLENVLTTIQSINPKVKKAYLRSDEAGCYHNSELIVGAKEIGKRVGLSVQRYDFSEPQAGKDVCDRILCPLKSAIRRYCNEGHDILTANDMRTALQQRPVIGSTAAVCQVNETKNSIVKKIPKFSAFHDFEYEASGLRVWKAFQVGTGKLIPWKDICITQQGATQLVVDEDNFEFTPKTIVDESLQDKGAKANGTSDEDEEGMFECPDPGCEKALNTVDDVDVHMCIGHHSTNIYDMLKRDWVEKFSFLTLDECDNDASKSDTPDKRSTLSDLNQGWALHKPKGGGSRFSDKVRQYLTSKFDIGQITGRKEDPDKVANDMRIARAENGERMFCREEWLTKSQIQGFFSRLSKKRKTSTLPNTEKETEDEDSTDEDDFDEDEIDHMNTVHAVINEIGLCHPIVYDVYDLCDYAKHNKLNAFTVPMLKEICKFFEVPFKSRDNKAALMSKVKEMISECSCSSES